MPTGYPQNLSVNTISATSAYLSWNELPLHQQNGIIIGYIISVFAFEDYSTFSLTSTSTDLIVTTLKPNRFYACRVAAQTSVGTGPFGTYFYFVTPEARKVTCMLKSK